MKKAWFCILWFLLFFINSGDVIHVDQRLNDSEYSLNAVFSTWLDDIMSPGWTNGQLCNHFRDQNNKLQWYIDFPFPEPCPSSSPLLLVSKARISLASIPLRCPSCLPLSLLIRRSRRAWCNWQAWSGLGWERPSEITVRRKLWCCCNMIVSGLMWNSVTSSLFLLCLQSDFQ